ncbi:MAG: hypothetical protein ABW092_03870 [Candidatus Thiodiazotropha sp.]
MNLLFSERPGRHERHLLRKYNNPLFPEASRRLTQAQLSEAQRLDHEELVAYIGDLRGLVGEAVALGPHEQSDVILGLKERLDKAYETAARLADDQTPNKEAIKKLLAVIMTSVWRGTGDDSVAHQELQQEEHARQSHFELLEFPLVADLLDPDSPIAADELLPSLLSAAADECEAALSLFDPNQLASLVTQAESLEGLNGEGKLCEQGNLRLEQLKAQFKSVQADSC